MLAEILNHTRRSHLFGTLQKNMIMHCFMCDFASIGTRIDNVIFASFCGTVMNYIFMRSLLLRHRRALHDKDSSLRQHLWEWDQ